MSGTSKKSHRFLWLTGGMSQLDTFDPKPDAPLEYRGEFAPISTNLILSYIGEHVLEMPRSF
jgi:hypothetical protein